jgi:predicted MFS family arabinose efflux permease
MGIGRFSFTPILPLMQQDMGLTIGQGTWLATSNYLGYLAGALICMAFANLPVQSVRFGLIGVATFTLAMTLSDSLSFWLAFRFGAGVASAFVLVGVSAWAMPLLTKYNKALWSGRVFAGVGVGIALAGLLGLAASLQSWGSRSAWLAVGSVAAMLAVLVWRPLAIEGMLPPAPASQVRIKIPRRVYVAIICYGLFGYGYIIPATFLPALARGYIDDPVVFGWIWPLFGTAAAVSTLIAARLGQRLAPRQLWIRAQWLMAAGVLAPVASVNTMTLLIAALCVGGTFVVMTMSGIKELMRISGPHAALAVGMGTAAFALGQIVGPLTVTLFAASHNAFQVPSIFAASALVISNFVLLSERSDAGKNGRGALNPRSRIRVSSEGFDIRVFGMRRHVGSAGPWSETATRVAASHETSLTPGEISRGKWAGLRPRSQFVKAGLTTSEQNDLRKS